MHGSNRSSLAADRRSAARGIFTISLDFELHWGVRDKRSVAQYRDALLGARQAIPRMLELFSRYGVHVTWATVGFLFCESKEQLVANIPAVLPNYTNRSLDPYKSLDEVGENEKEDPFHFAPSLIRQILAHPGQELATHTFSHFYCLEAGQTVDAFKSDLLSAQTVAEGYGTRLRSIVFPRNQYNPRYLDVLRELGLVAFRGNPRAWMYREGDDKSANRLSRRGARFADTYLPLTRPALRSGSLGATAPVDIRANRFLRPAGGRSAWRPRMHLWRVKQEMTAAARRGCLFHLWWHPHNFGLETGRKLAYLEALLQHFDRVRDRYAMEPMTMAEAAEAALGSQTAVAAKSAGAAPRVGASEGHWAS